MANFADDEIATVLSEKLGKQITAQQVEEKRNAGEGIKQIDANVEKYKIEIEKKLFQNLFNKHDKEGNKSVLERPVFKVIDRIANLAVSNHPPVDRQIELENRKYIEDELKKNLSLISVTPSNSL